MKKFLFIFILTGLILNGCTKAPSNNPINDEPQAADKATICASICDHKIPILCADELNDLSSLDANLDGSLMDPASCQLICESEWNENTLGCAADAEDCNQFMDQSPYCLETDKEDLNMENPEGDKYCSSACKKYGDCVMYADDATQEDRQYAIESCMEICPSWSEDTKNCVNKNKIRNSMDCANLSMCVLSKFN